MERAEETLASLQSEDDATEDGTQVEAEGRNAVGFRAGLITAALVQLAVVGLVAWSTIGLNERMGSLERAIGHQVDKTTGLEERIGALAAQHASLEREAKELRQFVASHTEEDVIFLKIVITKRDVDRALARTIAKHVHKYARIYGQDPDLVLAIIAVESDFDPEARSRVGAQGLMQVMPQWKQVLGIEEDLEDPETSIKYGLQILGFYRNMYKDLEMALTAYNRGPGPVDMALMRGESPMNKYAPRVLKAYRLLQSLETGPKKS